MTALVNPDAPKAKSTTDKPILPLLGNKEVAIKDLRKDDDVLEIVVIAQTKQ